jgi:hypothetical protein
MEPLPFWKSPRFGMVLILAGIFLPVFTFFFVDNFNARRSWAENVQKMYAQITADVVSPVFHPISDDEKRIEGFKIFNTPQPGVWIEYDPAWNEKDIERAYQTADHPFTLLHGPIGWRFCNWKTEIPGVRFRFRSALLLAFLLIFTGLWVIVLMWSRKSVHHTN